MVPLSEYATVPEGSTLFDAVLALEQAQEEFDPTKYRHRAVLILDKDKQVIGKLGQLDVLRALEPRTEDLGDIQALGRCDIQALGRFGFSTKFIRNVRKQARLQASPLKDICSKATRLRVEDFMQAPSEGEIIDEGASLEIAVLQLVMGNHLLLLVTRDRKIVGILRLADVFEAVSSAMKQCEITS